MKKVAVVAVYWSLSLITIWRACQREQKLQEDFQSDALDRPGQPAVTGASSCPLWEALAQHQTLLPRICDRPPPCLCGHAKGWNSAANLWRLVRREKETLGCGTGGVGGVGGGVFKWWSRTSQPHLPHPDGKTRRPRARVPVCWSTVLPETPGISAVRI